jgi:hypothetical protein
LTHDEQPSGRVVELDLEDAGVAACVTEHETGITRGC